MVYVFPGVPETKLVDEVSEIKLAPVFVNNYIVLRNIAFRVRTPALQCCAKNLNKYLGRFEWNGMFKNDIPNIIFLFYNIKQMFRILNHHAYVQKCMYIILYRRYLEMYITLVYKDSYYSFLFVVCLPQLWFYCDRGKMKWHLWKIWPGINLYNCCIHEIIESVFI